MFGFNAKKADAKLKLFETPLQRLPLRRDFPSIYSWGNRNKKFKLKLLAAHIERAVGNLGNHTEIPHITIAYPHKPPGFITGKPHRLVKQAYAMRAELMAALPQIKWVMADGLCETRKLKRILNKNQTIEKSIKTKQEFGYFPELQKEPLPFADPSNKETELFVLFDDIYCTGTTAANMINFIEHNGGHVIAAIAGEQPSYFPGHLTQTSTAHSRAFKNAAYNTGRIPEIADVLHRATQWSKRAAGFSPEECLDDLESGLNKWGHSLATLTDGECQLIKPYVEGYCTMTKKIPGHGYDGLIRAFSKGPYN